MYSPDVCLSASLWDVGFLVILAPCFEGFVLAPALVGGMLTTLINLERIAELVELCLGTRERIDTLPFPQWESHCGRL